jgi:hypothetical protein
MLNDFGAKTTKFFNRDFPEGRILCLDITKIIFRFTAMNTSILLIAVVAAVKNSPRKV